MKPFRAILFLTVGLLACLSTASAAKRPNILFISVDDMNCDSMGAYGCALPETTPHMDQLASEGLRFEFAHVQVGNCMPSRNVMFSGRYPHNNRVEGFYQVKDKDYPVLCDLMKEAGYLTAIRGKVTHSTPYHPYDWDMDVSTLDGEKQHVKDSASYGRSAKAAFDAAKEQGKPFCLLVNISDPHKPFYAMGKKQEVMPDPHVPTHVFTPEEVPIPGFLFDDPEVRLELAHYYSSVRRADDCLGEVMKELRRSGMEKNTVVVFLSDHGMPLPFAKTALYHHSTRTPWIVKWPGVTKAGSVDRQHMISAVDLLPTLLDVAGIKHPEGMDGHSFAPLLRGKSQDGRDFVFKVYNENSGAARHPMRGLQTKRFLYLYNPWSDGKNVFRTATTGTLTYKRMKALAEKDPAMAKRLDLFEHRVLEEFYDVENDPDNLNNLIDDPRFQKQLAEHRRMLEEVMNKSGDHLLEPFQNLNNVAIRKAYMVRVEKESADRRSSKGKGAKGSNAPKRMKGLIQLSVEDSDGSDGMVALKVHHKIPKRLGEQLLHVTLKDGTGKRIDRKVEKASGTGDLVVRFEIPKNKRLSSMMFSTFIGEEFGKHLEILHTEPVKVE